MKRSKFLENCVPSWKAETARSVIERAQSQGRMHAIAPTISEICAWYDDREIDLREGVRVVSIDRHARVARGSDGSFTTYDRLVLAIGMPGNNGLSIPGLQMRNGVIVNRSLETTDGYIYAIGGCAEVRDERWAARLGKQAQTLAAKLIGETDGVHVNAADGRMKLSVVPKPDSSKAEEAMIASS